MRVARKRLVAAMFAFLVIVVLASSGADGARAQGEDGRARSVIIFVGDGMGTSHRDLIRYATVGAGEELAVDSLPYAGMSRTSPEDPEGFVTNSAAGGTAIASGVKTFNGAVGVDAEGNAVTSVLEEAEQAGKATGLVTNSQVTDATPASFGAHVEDRDNQSEIARQYPEESEPEVILGGGEDYRYPEGAPAPTPMSRRRTPRRRARAPRGIWSGVDTPLLLLALAVLLAGVGALALVSLRSRY